MPGQREHVRRRVRKNGFTKKNGDLTLALLGILCLGGCDVELIYRFGAWLNAEVEIKIYDYDGIIAAAQSGNIDCIMANLNATEERRRHIKFSNCVYSSVTAVMARSEQKGSTEKKYGTLSDFAGARFAALSGGVYDKLNLA